MTDGRASGGRAGTGREPVKAHGGTGGVVRRDASRGASRSALRAPRPFVRYGLGAVKRNVGVGALAGRAASCRSGTRGGCWGGSPGGVSEGFRGSGGLRGRGTRGAPEGRRRGWNAGPWEGRRSGSGAGREGSEGVGRLGPARDAGRVQLSSVHGLLSGRGRACPRGRVCWAVRDIPGVVGKGVPGCSLGVIRGFPCRLRGVPSSFAGCSRSVPRMFAGGRPRLRPCTARATVSRAGRARLWRVVSNVSAHPRCHPYAVRSLLRGGASRRPSPCRENARNLAE